MILKSQSSSFVRSNFLQSSNEMILGFRFSFSGAPLAGYLLFARFVHPEGVNGAIGQRVAIVCIEVTIY